MKYLQVESLGIINGREEKLYTVLNDEYIRLAFHELCEFILEPFEIEEEHKSDWVSAGETINNKTSITYIFTFTPKGQKPHAATIKLKGWDSDQVHFITSLHSLSIENLRTFFEVKYNLTRKEQQPAHTNQKRGLDLLKALW